MGSRKPQAKAKQLRAFRAGLGSMDDVFAAESRRAADAAGGRAKARQHKACGSKNRYDSREEAEEVRRDCEAHGRRGLEIYRCDYCDGWHLTSHPWKD